MNNKEQDELSKLRAIAFKAITDYNKTAKEIKSNVRLALVEGESYDSDAHETYPEDVCFSVETSTDAEGWFPSDFC